MSNEFVKRPQLDGIFGDECLNKLYFPEKTDPIDFKIDDFRDIKIICSYPHTVKICYHKPTRLFIAAKLITYSASIKNDEKEKLRREVEIFRDLGNVENIVTFYGLCVDKDHAWICMELMDISLTDLYKEFHNPRDPSKTLETAKFPEEILGNITVRILDALIYCKSQKNIIHRDVKPHNILLNGKGQIKLCDFGVSRILENSLASSTVGTPWYWPPERFDKNNTAQYDIRADVWSLGITLLETVYRRLPYDDISCSDVFSMGNIIANANIKELIEKVYASQYSSHLNDFTKRCLNKYEDRANLNELQNTTFYVKYKTEANNKVVEDFISEYVTDQLFYSELQDKDTLNDLTIEWQRKILETSVTFQGKQISLKKLVNEHNEELKKQIDIKIIVKLLNNANFTIGSELVTLGDMKNYYINRSFTYPTISMEIFKESQDESQHKSKDLLAISGIDKTSLSDLVRKQDRICSFQNYNPDTSDHIRFVTLDDRQAAKQFKELCQLQPNRPTHWLTSDSCRLLWNQSQGSLSNLHKYIEKDNQKHTEDEWLKHINEYKVIIISDTAGMGKSTVLIHLAQKIKEQNPDLWIIRVNLNEYTNELKGKGDFQAHHINETTNMAIQFLEKDILKLSNPVEQELFKTHFKRQTSKLIIMFDGFDEISPDYRETVIKLIQALRNSTIKQIWVTTRSNERDVLEDKLEQLSYQLEPFSKDNQVDFLTKFWQQTPGLSEVTQEQQERLKDYAEALICIITKLINCKDADFIGIPLQTRMLAEAFEKDFAEFFNAKEAKLQLPGKLNLTDLYERFLKKKYDIQQEKIRLDISQPNVKAQSETGYSEFIEKHQNLALYTLIPEDKVDRLLCAKFYQEFSKEYPDLAKNILHDENNKQSLFKPKKQKLLSFINDIKTSKINNGIIDQIIEDKPHFIHRTFAEYLVGKFLVASLDNETVVEFVLQEILMQPAYQVTRAFLNDQLPESLLENTLARYGKHIERLWQSDKKNLYNGEGLTLLHIAAQEGAVNIIRFLLNSLKGHEQILESLVQAISYYNYHYRTALNLAAAGGYLDVVQCLIENGADVNVKSNDGTAVLHWAALGNLDVVQWLVEHGADVNVKSKYGETVLHWAARVNKWDVVQWLVEHGADVKSNYGETVLHWAARVNKWDVVQWLVEHGADVKSNYGETMLHWAAEVNKWDVVQWLVEHGADVNVKNKYGRIVLHYAARGNLNVVKWLVEHGADINVKSKYSETVLHWAARGNLDVVQWLVEHGADVNVKCNDGKTVLHCAAWGNLDVVQWLVEHGADVNVKDKYGETVLHWAARVNKWDVVQWLVEHGADIKSNYGETMLHWAAQKNKWDVVQCLVEHGADVNVKNNDGETMLHWAAEVNKWDVVQWMVEHGADVNVKNKYGRIVLHYAARGNLNVVQWLVEHGADVNVRSNDGTTVLHWAARDNLDVVQWLVEHGADVNVKSNDGTAVLHCAALGNLDVVQWLVEHGADVNVKSKYGETVLHWAARVNKWDVVQWLVEHGADIKSNYGETMLHWAAQKNKWDVVQCLVEHGADVNVKSNDGETVLHWAARGNLDVVQWLVEHGADVNVKSDDGETVLHWAACNLDVVQWLVELGADVNFKSKYGVTVLHYAARGNLNVVQWLVEHGADVNVKSNDGKTVLHWAAQENKWDVIQWLLEHGVDVNIKSNDGETVLHWAARVT